MFKVDTAKNSMSFDDTSLSCLDQNNRLVHNESNVIQPPQNDVDMLICKARECAAPEPLIVLA